MDRSRLLSAENKATDILARAGIDARRMDCPVSEAELDNYPDCQLPRWATDFVLKVLPKTMEDSRTIWRDSMGFRCCEEAGSAAVEALALHVPGAVFWCEVYRPLSLTPQLREAEIENFGIAALGHKNVCRLDVTMDDARGVRRVQRIGNLKGDLKQPVVG